MMHSSYYSTYAYFSQALPYRHEQPHYDPYKLECLSYLILDSFLTKGDHLI